MIKKGQTGVEFIVSTFVFLITISYASLTIINSMPVYHDYSVTENLISKSYQVSQYLIFDYLSAGSNYLIDESEIDNLAGLCNTRENIVNKLGVPNHDVVINIEKIDGTNLLDCKSGESEFSKQIIVRRFAVLDNANKDVIRMEVAVI